MIRLLDDSDPDRLIAVGAAILIAGITADNVNAWLKQLASRPRYKYLITLDDPISQFRSWWQMVPNLAGSDDSFKSWPNGNMTNHFLSDVCFGTLITYIIYAVISEAFLSAARAN